MLMLSSKAFAEKRYGDLFSVPRNDLGVGNTATNSVEQNNTLPVIVGVANNAGTDGATENGAAGGIEVGKNGFALDAKNHKIYQE
ncbi:hypothetical protein HAINFHK1212_0278 [Haemophilus influenzae HK1212]|uniref:Uncharacterized protein n=1 Tax=Haemophilus influenzae HK1212 TaxID=456482 RepID=A0A7G2JZL5_HAEIF|nr:hypothetical protein HAINFHK1212_0278 [Haemophilus influenzae HK1212]